MLLDPSPAGPRVWDDWNDQAVSILSPRSSRSLANFETIGTIRAIILKPGLLQSIVIGIAQYSFFEIEDGGHAFCTLLKFKVFLKSICMLQTELKRF